MLAGSITKVKMRALLVLGSVLGAASWHSEMELALRPSQRAAALLQPIDALQYVTRLRGGADEVRFADAL